MTMRRVGMSSFEYLRSIGIGYYYPGDSFLHRMDARSKVIFFFLLILGLTLTSSPAGLGMGLVVGLIGFGLARVSLKPCLRTLLGISPFMIFLFVLQLFIFRPQTSVDVIWQWKFLHVYAGAFRSALVMVVRFVSLVVLLSLMTSVVSTLEMNHGIALLLQPLVAIGIHTDMLVMVIQVMLRFLPLLALRMEQIAKSQASRGAQWDSGSGGILKRARLTIPLLIPLFLSILEQSERTADAMLCRCYGVSAKRSHYYEHCLSLTDVLFILVGAGLTILITYLQRLGY